MENKTDELTAALQQMQHNLKRISDDHSENTWLQTAKNKLNEKLSGDKTLSELAKETGNFIASYVIAQVGTVYIAEKDVFYLHYAYGIKKGQADNSFLIGEGLVGQVAAEKSLRIIKELPKNYFNVSSSLGKEKPDTIAVLPAVFNNKVVAVIELGKFGDYSPIQLKFLEEIAEVVAISINTVVEKRNLEKLIIQLREKEQELNNRINAINKSNASVELDLNGTILSANESFCRILGYSEKELIGKQHSMLVEKGYETTKEYADFWNQLRRGVYQTNEFKRITKSGTTVWIRGNYNPILDLENKPYKILKIATDISIAKMQQIEIDAITAGIYKSNIAIEFDLNGKVLKANDIFLDIMGYKESEVIGKHHSFFVEKGYETSEEYHTFWNKLQKGEYQTGEFKRITKSGQIVWIKGNYNPILNTEGKPYKILKIATDVTLARRQAEELGQQTEELQMQQEELKQINDELESQAQGLKQQQEELQMSNEELEEQTQALEMKNKELERARAGIALKTQQLEMSSKYKSEFLANMSHELRTPLNSLLILSKDLADNKKKNLTLDQIESAQIINKSGHDLLELINEVLDLSKIEAGKMLVTIEWLSIKDFALSLTRNFKHQTEAKKLKLDIHLGDELPEAIRTDTKRFDQIIRNLMSNAIKFTTAGTISVSIEKKNDTFLSIAVKDTGIGIAPEKQQAIFEAFQQADGSTSRKYGGTGLGLSISRELAKLLNGEINLVSKVDEGSTFTFTLPLILDEQSLTGTTLLKKLATDVEQQVAVAGPANRFYNYPTIADDRLKITENDRALLIIEDDLKFAQILINQAHAKNFKCLTAATGEDGLLLAEHYKPQAIILDIDLPGIDGHQVLAELKINPIIRHIPVHIISGNEETIASTQQGAVTYLTKPVNKNELEEVFDKISNFINRKMKNLLIIEDDEGSRKAIKKLIGNGDVQCFEAGTGKEAIALFKHNQIDCIVLDLGLPDISGFDLIHQLEELKKGQLPPITIYTGRELSKQENEELQKYTETIIIKGVKSEERLLDETALFLHRTISDLPEAKQKIITGLYDKESVFNDKKILVVDDDMRNVFALSKVLKERGMEIYKAENGAIALSILKQQPRMDMVLMDIMMPIMDGYEAMREIRAQPRFNKLPLIAITAKAMKDDKQKCMDAGASDYISKPVDIDRLLVLMRIWLNK